MKRALLLATAALGLGCFAQAAYAADMPRHAPPRAEYPTKAPAYQPYDWTGFYGGINAGYGWGDSKFNLGGVTSNSSPEGALLGGTIGYNYQWGQTVFGVEGDFDWSDAHGRTGCVAGTCETKNRWLSTVRGRLGYAVDRFMPYITGGAAFGDVNANIPGVGSDRDTRAGWTVGAGAEYAFTPNWSVKAEYLYVDLGKLNCAACGGNVKFNENIVRTGLNYKF
jgi:outer membrane immunogenic protein